MHRDRGALRVTGCAWKAGRRPCGRLRESGVHQPHAAGGHGPVCRGFCGAWNCHPFVAPSSSPPRSGPEPAGRVDASLPGTVHKGGGAGRAGRAGKGEPMKGGVPIPPFGAPPEVRAKEGSQSARGNTGPLAAGERAEANPNHRIGRGAASSPARPVPARADPSEFRTSEVVQRTGLSATVAWRRIIHLEQSRRIHRVVRTGGMGGSRSVLLYRGSLEQLVDELAVPPTRPAVFVPAARAPGPLLRSSPPPEFRRASSMNGEP